MLLTTFVRDDARIVPRKFVTVMKCSERSGVTMARVEIPLEDLNLNIPELWTNSLLLCSGDFETNKFNMMTVGWGFFGYAWGKTQAQVMVRKSRYTYEFMEQYPDFTLSAFDLENKEHQECLQVLGTKSGREIDKITGSGLTPIRSKSVKTPSFKEAILTLECNKDYSFDLDQGRFLSGYIPSIYDDNDYHRIYCGEVVMAFSNLMK